ncbi:unnamed protein product [Thelazia callipaeda]|uniref:Doublecortin domain-containing protein n=1 Tax=Thelazia callipaeda TaxID=103827 RepID=A0A158RBN1_THECL|nr:unnamed protein product [Thelazia callipaeda]
MHSRRRKYDTSDESSQVSELSGQQNKSEGLSSKDDNKQSSPKMNSAKCIRGRRSPQNLKIGSRPKVVPPKLSGDTKWRYVGVCTKNEAESYVPHCTEFRLYHQWNSMILTANSLQMDFESIDRLPLTVVYHASTKMYFHWLVRTMGELIENKDKKVKEFVIRSYYIEHGGPCLSTLDALIRSYETHTYSRKGQIDVFHIP